MNELKMTYIYSPAEFLIGSLINGSLINYRIYFDLRPVDEKALSTTLSHNSGFRLSYFIFF